MCVPITGCGNTNSSSSSSDAVSPVLLSRASPALSSAGKSSSSATSLTSGSSGQTGTLTAPIVAPTVPSTPTGSAPIVASTTSPSQQANSSGGAGSGAAPALSTALTGQSTSKATRVLLTGDTNRPNNSTFVLGETVQLTFHASGLLPYATNILSIRIVDEIPHEIYSASLSMPANSAGSAVISFPAPATKYGYYRVFATLSDGTSLPAMGTRPAGFITYAVVPDPSKRVDYGDSGSRFGMQGGFSAAQGNVIQYLGIRYLLDGPGWANLEPQYPGQFAASQKAATSADLTYPSHIADNASAWPTYAVPLVIVSGLPAWAMIPGTGTASWPAMGALNSTGVEALPEFTKARAKEVSKDFADQSTHYYQMTWEPEIPGIFGGTPAQLVQLYQDSYQSIHAADPKAIVMGPTLFPGDRIPMTQLWSAGLAQYLDAVSMHPYTKFPPETNGLVENIRLQMQMAKTAKGTSLPFVGTEHGFASGVIGALDEALGDIRTSIILLGEGFKFDFGFYIADFWVHSPSETNNTFGYYWNLDPAIAYGTDKLGPKPAVPAFAAMTFLLDGSTSSGPVESLTGTQIGYRFSRGDVNVIAMWDYQVSASDVWIPVSAETIQVCDWMGNCSSQNPTNGNIKVTLSPYPSYVIGKGI